MYESAFGTSRHFTALRNLVVIGERRTLTTRRSGSECVFFFLTRQAQWAPDDQCPTMLHCTLSIGIVHCARGQCAQPSDASQRRATTTERHAAVSVGFVDRIAIVLAWTVAPVDEPGLLKGARIAAAGEFRHDPISDVHQRLIASPAGQFFQSTNVCCWGKSGKHILALSFRF